jgi:hypothetical protein
MFNRLAVVLVILALMVAHTHAAEPLRPSWTCIPEDTPLLIRAPSIAAFFEAVQARTKLGQVVFSSTRLEQVWSLVKEKAGDEWEYLVKELAKIGLKPDDFRVMLNGEVGTAIVAEPRDGRPPLVVSLAWFEPGEETGARLLEAMQKSIEEQRDSRDPTVRVDIDLAGHSVMQLTTPEFRLDVDENDLDAAPDPKKTSKAEMKAWRERRAEQAKHIPTGQSNVLVTRVGGRILTATTLSSLPADEQKKLSDPNEKIDLNAVAGLEELKGIFARFLAAHSESGERPTLRILQTPGLAGALPAGLPLLEVIGDPRPLWKLVPQDESPASRLFRAFAVEQIGPLAIRLSLERTELHGAFFLSAPAPRKGIVALLDQMPLQPEPPAWVPLDVIDYTQASFHFGKAYAAIKELVIGEMGDSARQGIEFLELQVKNTLQTDLESLLGSLGQQLVSLTFSPQQKRVEAHNITLPLDRISLVAQIKDEAPWKRVLSVVQSHLPGGAVEEQGFSGVRIDQSPVEGGFFVGRGYLVLGIGPDTVEPTLAALRNPPGPEQALRSSALFRRAGELIPAQPSLLYSLTDGNRQVKSLRQMLLNLLDAASELRASPDSPKDDAELPDVATIEKLRTFLPSEQEFEGALGVSVTEATVTDHGLIIREVLDLPAP